MPPADLPSCPDLAVPVPGSGNFAAPLPKLGPEARTAEGRLAAWVFDLPVAELRAGYRSAVYFDRARRILAAEGDDSEVTIQVFQRTGTMVACGIDEALAVLAVGAGSMADQRAADETFATYLAARNAARRARPASGDWLEAVQGRLAAEVELDGLWRPAGDALRVKALRDGDLVSPWEPVIEVTGPYRLVAHLESVYGAPWPGAPWWPRTCARSWTRPAASRCCSSPTVTTTGRPRAATATPPSSAAPRVWPPTPRRPGGERGLGTIPHALIATFRGDTRGHAGLRPPHPRGAPDRPGRLLQRLRRDLPGLCQGLRRPALGARLDTSSTLVDRSLWQEMGDFNPTGVNSRLVAKVRQALDAEGFEHVRVVCSGGFTAERIAAFEREGVPVDSYAVGSALLKGSADHTADVVLREGVPCAKVGRRHRSSDRLQAVHLAPQPGPTS